MAASRRVAIESLDRAIECAEENSAILFFHLIVMRRNNIYIINIMLYNT